MRVGLLSRVINLKMNNATLDELLSILFHFHFLFFPAMGKFQFATYPPLFVDDSSPLFDVFGNVPTKSKCEILVSEAHDHRFVYSKRTCTLNIIKMSGKLKYHKSNNHSQQSRKHLKFN